MRIIRAPSIGRAHELVIKMILEKGWVLHTEDAEATIEFEEITLQVDTPLAEPAVSPSLPVPAKICRTVRPGPVTGIACFFRVRLSRPAV